MAVIRFGEIRHLPDLASALGTTVDDIVRFTQPGEQAQCYAAIRLPKKGKRRKGEFRTVYKVAQELRILQKQIATAVAECTTFDGHVQGFVNGRSIVTNATVHLGQRILLHADIRHFFETITVEQVDRAFRALGCVPEVASALARVCTLDGHLPEGSSASPIIANLVAGYLDNDLKTLAQAHGCRYTRYADDITFSGDSVPDSARVAAILLQHGFALRDGTCRTQHKGRGQYVTGLTIADTRRPRLPRVAKRRLRLELHYAARFGLENHLERAGRSRTRQQEMKRLGGWISFMSSVEGKAATQRFYDRWLEIGSQEEPEVQSPDD
jgi:retron-type reverse transcriptase